ncbi:MAG: DinB family protein [Planctomycetota bacterium]|nr:MAG: DinB family protein [Planctomycetota bacterium]
MLKTLKEVLTNQFHAALCTLNDCIDRCPDSAWNSKIVNLEFNQAAFHTLIYTDYYLGDGEETFRRQLFHRENEGRFGDYEEFEDRVQVATYERSFIQAYMAHCRTKLSETIAAETAESLSAESTFPWLTFSRAEVYVYTIRHIQHHAAQLILRLRRDYQQDMPWFKSGWPPSAK